MSLKCFFVSDLHGTIGRYQSLFSVIEREKPDAVFIGGDILPSHLMQHTMPDILHQDFIHYFLQIEFSKIKSILGKQFPKIFVILGNDDGRFPESSMLDVATTGLWEYIHNRCVHWQGHPIYGYSYVPPTPFNLKDWERYDVSRYVPPGAVPLEEGGLSIPVSESELLYSTISEDLLQLTEGKTFNKSIFLFHSPPYDSKLDRAALDGKMIDHVPLDLHVGSIAIQRFIEERQPLITLHGHIHESSRMTGAWQDKIGRTYMYSAAHDGPELALVRFNPAMPAKATRELI